MNFINFRRMPIGCEIDEAIKVPIPNPFVVFREEFDDRAILFDPDKTYAVRINPVGIAVWKMMNGRIDIIEITSEIRKLFVCVPDTASEEIPAFIGDLHSIGFIKYSFER